MIVKSTPAHVWTAEELFEKWSNGVHFEHATAIEADSFQRLADAINNNQL